MCSSLHRLKGVLLLRFLRHTKARYMIFIPYHTACRGGREGAHQSRRVGWWGHYVSVEFSATHVTAHGCTRIIFGSCSAIHLGAGVGYFFDYFFLHESVTSLSQHSNPTTAIDPCGCVSAGFFTGVRALKLKLNWMVVL